MNDELDTDELDRTPDPKLWDLYLNDCRHNKIYPKYKDYLIWLEEQDDERV